MNSTLARLKSITYHVAIYIRLSKEDDKDGESESITNQKSLLLRFVEENGYELADIYIDDGYSGTNFNRPNFLRMKKDIETGKINMVVTKDLSRLGRDYIGTGEYLERYFPNHSVRYIAITDNIDTALDNSNNDMVPFRAVFNDMYAKDISKKIRSALRSKQQDGKWVGGCTPFGYKQDPDNNNRLIVEEKEAAIVKRIFQLALTGKTPYHIKTILTEEKVPTVSQIRPGNRTKHGHLSKTGIWNQRTIKSILTNQLYVGDMVQNRRSRISYKLRKTVWNSKDEWIIVENTHEPLVNKKDFEYIQSILSKNNIRPAKKEYRLLDGLLYCYECKHRLGICAPRKSDGRTYMVCNYYRMHSKYNVCTSHGFNYDYLEKKILDTIRLISASCLDTEELAKQADEVRLQSPIDNLKGKIELLKKEVEKSTENLDKMYIDKLSGKINEEMFERINIKITDEIALNNKKIKTLCKVLEGLDNKDQDKKLHSLLREFLTVKEPTRDMMLRLIEKIDIHKDKEVDVCFNFKELNFLLLACHAS